MKENKYDVEELFVLVKMFDYRVEVLSWLARLDSPQLTWKVLRRLTSQVSARRRHSGR